MAPFYTILSIWVGAIILCAMLKVTISDREKAHVLGLGDTLPRIAGPSGPGNASRWGLRLDHEYFGRYAIFALLALLQGTLVCLGDTYFLGVQANHALQFLAVGWLAALVFSNIVYTLTVSFGDIGKARGRGAAGDAGRRFGRYVPYRDAAEVLPNALPVPTIPARHRCHARRDGPDHTAMSTCLTWCISPCS